MLIRFSANAISRSSATHFFSSRRTTPNSTPLNGHPLQFSSVYLRYLYYVVRSGDGKTYTAHNQSTQCVGSAVDGWCPPLPSGQVMTPNVQSSRVESSLSLFSRPTFVIGLEWTEQTPPHALVHLILYFQFPKYNYYGHQSKKESTKIRKTRIENYIAQDYASPCPRTSSLSLRKLV